MIYLFIGTIIGGVLGLTGAGGSLVAIPLFIYLLDMPLKEASVLSLLAVIIAASFNFFSHYQHTAYKTSFIMFVGSALGSLLSAPFKKFFPDLFLAILLGLISLYSLWTVWRPLKYEKKRNS